VSKRRDSKKQKPKKHHHTVLSKHQRVGKKLIPPLVRVSNLSLQSWTNERLPELIWIALLLQNVGRDPVLELIRTLGTRIGAAGGPETLTLSGIASALPAARQTVIDFVCHPVEARQALTPLLLFPELPGYDEWASGIGMTPEPSCWHVLGDAAAGMLNHQSEASTDARWAVVIAMLGAGKLRFPLEMADRVKEIALYPHMGDLQMVRPFIRSAEGGLSFNTSESSASQWSKDFWDRCMRETACAPLQAMTAPASPIDVGTTRQSLSRVSCALQAHANSTRVTTAVDARHDSVFGLALYCMSLLSEVLSVGASTTISARLILRTMLEAYLTLAYLVRKDTPDTWMAYRVHGSGQAKLSMLKAYEAEDIPHCISIERLEELAGEDMWQELVSIDLGHWANANLRQLSNDAEKMDDYDRLYPWTSVFVHSQWCGVRDTVFDICGNPLHRVHRIPRSYAQPSPDVVVDATGIADKVLCLVHEAYPGFPLRLACSRE
jgi:hypothetical protein